MDVNCLSLVESKLQYINDFLIKDKNYVADNNFSIADLYLYVVLTSEYKNSEKIKEILSALPPLSSYLEFIKTLPLIQAAHKTIDSVPAPTTTAIPEK